MLRLIRALQPVANVLGPLWLRFGKWQLSRLLAGRDWPVHVGALGDVQAVFMVMPPVGLVDLVARLRVAGYWLPDPLFQLWDRVYPPVQLLQRQGDDCDGWAMFHAQAVEAFLPVGWEARIGSYLADPWDLSHHVALVTSPEGDVWAIQPQPSKGQAGVGRLVFGPYATDLDALQAIAKLYGSRVVWHDVRRSDGSAINR